MDITWKGRLAYAAAKLRYRWQQIVPDAHPVYVRRTTLGAELDVSALVEHMLLELCEQVAENPGEMCSLLEHIGNARFEIEAERHLDGVGFAAAERDLLVQQLMEDVGGSRMRLVGPEALRLAELIRVYCSEAAPAAVVQLPRQRRAGGAAA